RPRAIRRDRGGEYRLARRGRIDLRRGEGSERCLPPFGGKRRIAGHRPEPRAQFVVGRKFAAREECRLGGLPAQQTDIGLAEALLRQRPSASARLGEPFACGDDRRGRVAPGLVETQFEASLLSGGEGRGGLGGEKRED